MFDEIRILEQILLQNEKTPLPLNLQARLFNTLGKANHSFFNNFERARFYHHKALAIWQQLDDKKEIARAILDIGWHYFMQMKLEEAINYADKILRVTPELESKWNVAAALHLKGMALMMAGKPEQAIPLADQSLIIWRELGDKTSLVSTLAILAQCQVRQGKYEEVKPVIAEAFALQLETGNAMGVSVSNNILADLAANAQKQPEGAIRACQLLGNTFREFENVNGTIPPLVAAILAKIIATIKSILNEESYSREYEVGKNLTRAELIILVEEITRPEALLPAINNIAALTPGKIYPLGLTGREVEILRLVAAGLSNPQIAEKLILSRRTVELHLHTIFSKIEVSSRVEATRFAINYGLV